MKIVFMGTPAFSVPILNAIAAQHDIVAVYCQPPRPAGRGKADRPSPVQARAEAVADAHRRQVPVERERLLSRRGAEAVSVPQHSNVVPMWVASAATGAA